MKDMPRHLYDESVREALERGARTGAANKLKFSPEMDAALLDGRDMHVPWTVLAAIFKSHFSAASENTLKRRYNELREVQK